MKAAFYTRTGTAREVLQIADLPEPVAGVGEVKVRLHWSGVNPSDVKSRADLRGRGMPYPRVIPHSDGAGVIEAVGPGVPASRVGERVWVWNGAFGRPDGTAAECIVLPAAQAVALPANVPMEAGACLGIPALTALHAVRGYGGVAGQRVLVRHPFMVRWPQWPRGAAALTMASRRPSGRTSRQGPSRSCTRACSKTGWCKCRWFKYNHRCGIKWW
jgi:NADPH2:quinone reductase